MNQSILFNDDAIWLESEQSVRFSAQALGSLIQCHISRHRLESLAGGALPRPVDLLGAFASHRFEIEELAEQHIEAQEFAEDGGIYLF